MTEWQEIICNIPRGTNNPKTRKITMPGHSQPDCLHALDQQIGHVGNTVKFEALLSLLPMVPQMEIPCILLSTCDTTTKGRSPAQFPFPDRQKSLGGRCANGECVGTQIVRMGVFRRNTELPTGCGIVDQHLFKPYLLAFHLL